MRARGYDLGMESKKRAKKKQLGGLMALDTFGKRLRVLRQDRGLSQIDLRDALQRYAVEIGETYISELERTDKMPSLAVAAGMAKVLNISVDYLALLTDEARSYVPEARVEYIAPEADEVAGLMDGMTQDQREALLGMARSLTAPRQETRRMREGLASMLDSVERQEGAAARREMERRLREIGLRWDNA